MKLGRLPQALDCLDQALKAQPRSAPYLLKRGQLFLALKQADHALQDLERAHAIDLNMSTVNFYLGQAHSDLNQWEKALEHYDNFLAQHPQSFEAYTNRGHVLKQLGRPELALESYQSALGIEPNFHMTHLNLGVLYQETQQLELAVESYQRALALNPHTAPTHSNLGSALKALGKYQDAKQSFDQAIEIDPNYEASHFNLGQLYFELQQFEWALQSFSKAIELNADFADAYFHRAHLYFQQENFALAKADIVQCIRAGFQRQVEAEYILQALESETFNEAPPAQFVSNLFNQYAAYFERQLVDELGYQGPALMLAQLQAHLKRGPYAILDLGCGTGLSGGVLTPFAHNLVGVDLSSRMLEKAREKNIYSSLFESDVVEFLNQTDQTFEVVVSMDVFIYLGDLGAVFQGVGRVLKPEGYFAFTVEEEEGASFSIYTNTMRFKHSKRYCDALASEHGYDVLGVSTARIRQNLGSDVMGLYYVLQKNAP